MKKTLCLILPALICVFLLVAFTSCTSKMNQGTASSATPPPGSFVIPSPSHTATPFVKFVTNLTQNGIGLVRDVPASSYNATAPSSLAGDFDIRGLDCSKYLNNDQLQDLIGAIPNVTFNSDTVWPSNLPSDYNYSDIFEAGKKPGLGVAALHSEGITGKGVSIAIIDQILLTDHIEYKDNLVLYEEIHVAPNEPASMHGSAVSSIAVGKTCGVAPDAKLYYWAINFAINPSSKDHSDGNVAFADGVAVAVDRMLEVNSKLPENQKIRVLSISRGFSDL